MSARLVAIPVLLGGLREIEARLHRRRIERQRLLEGGAGVRGDDAVLRADERLAVGGEAGGRLAQEADRGGVGFRAILEAAGAQIDRCDDFPAASVLRMRRKMRLDPRERGGEIHLLLALLHARGERLRGKLRRAVGAVERKREERHHRKRHRGHGAAPPQGRLAHGIGERALTGDRTQQAACCLGFRRLGLRR